MSALALPPNLTLTPKQIRFLRCFEACASVTQAARWAKINKRTHYDWLEASSEYKRAFEAAEPVAARTLEDEAVRRAREGVRKAVWHKGKIVGYQTEFSDSLMQTLLKGTNPKKFRENSSVELTGKDGKPLFDFASIRAFIKQANPEGE